MILKRGKYHQIKFETKIMHIISRYHGIHPCNPNKVLKIKVDASQPSTSARQKDRAALVWGGAFEGS